ncbi:MAG: DinB family protein [Bacillota bacterium]|uniref:DinB family protein n=1 Tax=Virgibacillus salarius TaxID=447199 RepID=A0A941I8P2_9BACI|nr:MULTISPECIES: DinB family protein [Bacillaceae]NAZ07380.1 DUF1569 domain-containing protein [Agaribacter marinus]MBR7794658.1 DinB family protein [Virgibacillus salarius]MCC2250943.1 DinB family protein [Virgibacillus sp. AGTR]MDY7044795.1 DinB family protein [Virgibacillus sp. M23]QRZ16389.1 DinB family protein [Virgibacillus sp. AGTR]
MQINEQARESLLSEVNGLTDEEINKKASADRWSVKQIMEHLYLMEVAITKIIQQQLITGDTVHVSEKPIHFTVNRSVKVDSPDFAVPSEDFVTLEEMKQKLAASHQGLRQLNETADKKTLREKSYPHPAFGDLSLEQYIPFVGYHEKRHIEQIKEVKAAFNN